MTLKTTTRVSAAVGALLAVLGTITVVLSSPAGALEKERVVLGQDEHVELTYGPLVGANQGALIDASTTVNTELCTAATFCDVIPLTVLPPRDFTLDDADFFVRIALSWDSYTVNNVPLEGNADVDDYDLWIVNDPFDPEAGPDEDGFAYSSASLSNPELVQMYAPVGDWNILVNNAAGRSLSYTLDISWATTPYPTPFEALPPEFTSTGSLSPSPAKPSLVTPSAPVGPPPAVFDVGTPATPSLTPSQPPLADSSFSEGFDDGVGLEDELAAPPATVLQFSPVAEDSAPSPSGLGLVLWLLAFPLLLVAIAGWYLQRRQSTAISI